MEREQFLTVRLTGFLGGTCTPQGRTSDAESSPVPRMAAALVHPLW
jgi:hypothetical protein